MSATEGTLSTPEARFRERYLAGPTDTGWDTLPPQAGDTAPDLGLADHEGTLTSLSEHWRDRPLILIFWRHFGCGCGLARAERLREEHAAFRMAGAHTVVVGQGEPDRAAAYKRDQHIPCPILCDPSLEAYRAYGLRQGTVAQIFFDAPEEFWRHDTDTVDDLMTARRESGRPLVDDPWMLPGEFVIDTAGTIRHAHRYQHCEDFPDPRVLTTAVRTI